MALTGIPQNAQQVGEIAIVVYLTAEGGLGLSYGFDGMGLDEAIGRMTVTLDRLRDERRAQWDTCPDCGEPWESHVEFDGEDFDEEDDEDEDD